MAAGIRIKKRRWINKYLQEATLMEDKIQTGLRIPENQYNRIKERADRMGVSINQLILVLVDIGLNLLDKEQAE